ncbi:MAG: S41 family peptidase [Bacteroidales bacterium]|nr:S41 family peptidase [Bacteroidales bacterium]
MSKKNLIVLIPILMMGAAITGVFFGHQAAKVGSRSVGNFMSTPQQYMQNPNSKLGTIVDIIEQQYVDVVDLDSITELVIPELLKHLDPHSIYIPARNLAQVNNELKSNFGGIGVQFTIREDTVNIVSVISGGPASKLGVLPGDKIIKVNGYDFVGKKISNEVVMDSLRGEFGSKVNVTLLRNHDEEINIDIIRGVIPMYSVDVSYMLNDSVGYLRIDRFAEKTYEEMMTGIAKLRSMHCTKLVVDLRGNSGGLLDVVIKMCNEFLPANALIVYTEGAHQSREETRANGLGTCQDLGVVVLIDEYSASASEIFAGAMQDNDRGIIIGRRSFGKGLVQTQMELFDQSALRLTIARYHTPSGRCIQRPYSDGVDDYYEDTYKRYSSGELFNADSVKVDENQSYTTIGGRIVFGGGGIIPDIFVPRDTTIASNYLIALRTKNVIYNFSLDYADKHRNDNIGKMNNKQLINFLKHANLMSEIEAYAAKKGVVYTKTIKNDEKKYILTEARALIGRNLRDNEVFYPILNEADDVVMKALEVINSGETVLNAR